MKRWMMAVLCALMLTGAGALHADDDLESLGRQAMAAYGAKDFGRSADLFTQAIALDAENGNLLYAGACAASLAGRPEQALNWLERIVVVGGVAFTQVKDDADLAALHANPRWAAFLVNAERAEAQRMRLWRSTALAPPYRDTLTEDERVAGLSKLWAEAKFNFVNFDLVPELDWDARYAEFLPRVRAVSGTVDYYRELERFMAHLHDGHSGVWVPNEAFDAVYAAPGLNTRLAEGRVFVESVFDPALSALGVRPGWEVVAVEGRTVADYAKAQIEPYQSYSTEQDRKSRLFERSLLEGPVATPVTVALRDGRGRTHTLALPRMPYLARMKQSSGPAFEWKMLPGRIAWVALRSFADDGAAKAFEDDFAGIAEADAIIFDVRDNSGGDSAVGYRILAKLTDTPFRTSAWHTRQYRPTLRAWGRNEGRYDVAAETVPPDGDRHYRKPVVVLTSARTYSAAEDFVVAFDAMRRGKIIGEPTGGSTGQPLMFRLPGGGTGRVCTKRDTYPDGREFVGIGVQPNVYVAPTARDFRAGKDTVLDAALKSLRK